MGLHVFIIFHVRVLNAHPLSNMRCNCGVDPQYLTDQWLIAEQVELLMVAGYLKRVNFQPKSPIPKKMAMGTGYILFWVDKMTYLERRLDEVKVEVANRGFKVMKKEISDYSIPLSFYNDWQPSQEDTDILRERLVWKLDNKPNIWRFQRNPIPTPLTAFKSRLLTSPLFYV